MPLEHVTIRKRVNYRYLVGGIALGMAASIAGYLAALLDPFGAVSVFTLAAVLSLIASILSQNASTVVAVNTMSNSYTVDVNLVEENPEEE